MVAFNADFDRWLARLSSEERLQKAERRWESVPWHLKPEKCRPQPEQPEPAKQPPRKKRPSKTSQQQRPKAAASASKQLAEEEADPSVAELFKHAKKDID